MVPRRFYLLVTGAVESPRGSGTLALRLDSRDAGVARADCFAALMEEHLVRRLHCAQVQAMHKVLYLDTNSFLQLRDLKDLAWTELIPGLKAVDLVVARVVIDELDKHKVGTNQRRRDRSRAALRLIDAASEAETRSIVLRDAPVRVVLSIAPRRRVDYESLGLDAAEPDDRLVGATATHEGAEIMSHDSGPRVTARDLSIVAHSPPEGWLLPPERSDDQRKLAEAERRIKQLQDAKADVRIKVLGAEDDGKVVARRLIPPALPPTVANRLTARLIRLHPPVDLPSAGTGLNAQLRLAGGQAFGEPTIRRYYEDRNQWELEVQRWTSILDRHVARRTSEVKVRFGLDNAGASSAENLVVELETNEGLSLLADDEDADGLLGNLSPPSPPEPPKVRPSFDITNLGLSLAQPVPRRDPTAMSWIDRPCPGASRASYGCEDFRPGRKYEDAALAIRSTEANGGLVRIEASANHMPARAVEVQIKFEDAIVEWTDERVLAALPPDVAEAVRAEFC